MVAHRRAQHAQRDAAAAAAAAAAAGVVGAVGVVGVGEGEAAGAAAAHAAAHAEVYEEQEQGIIGAFRQQYGVGEWKKKERGWLAQFAQMHGAAAAGAAGASGVEALTWEDVRADGNSDGEWEQDYRPEEKHEM